MQFSQWISSRTQIVRLPDPLELESGEILPEVDVAYCTWGSLNAERDNAVLVCHALTGWADLSDWWDPLLGKGKALDPTRDFIVCSNILGSCYGTTGPTAINPENGRMYGSRFPRVTVRDMVHLQARLVQILGVERIRAVIGGSLGGMQTLEWGVLYPNWVERLVPIACSGRHSPWCIGLSETQRQAIFLDPNWNDGNYDPSKGSPIQGLAVARMLAMSSYRSWASFREKFGRNQQEESPDFAISSYLRYQGEKLVERFDANAYVGLTFAMDSHDLGRERDDYHQILQGIRQPTLVISIDSDILYPPEEQEELAQGIPHARLETLHSIHGHDGFLIDMDSLNRMIYNFLNH